MLRSCVPGGIIVAEEVCRRVTLWNVRAVHGVDERDDRAVWPSGQDLENCASGFRH
jgi:hypothetical protein